MNDFIVEKHCKKPVLKNPYLIEGLPGIGNVARIAVDFLIDKTKAKKYLTLYSKSFPNSIFINDDSTLELPSVEFYYAKSKGKDFIFVIGDFQPVNEKDSYNLAEEILRLSNSLGIKQIITLGGIGLPDEPDKPKVHATVTNKKYFKQLKTAGALLDGNKKVKIVIGIAGLLLGLGKIKGFDGFALLGETFAHPMHIGVKTSKEILNVLIKYLNLNVSLHDLSKEIKQDIKELKDEMNLMNQALKKDQKTQENVGGYIG